MKYQKIQEVKPEWTHVAYGPYYNEQGKFKIGPYTKEQVVFINSSLFPVIKEYKNQNEPMRFNKV